jgi:cytochrome oxidase Cu insertion factor (SCO1/SenC/PrrC family)
MNLEHDTPPAEFKPVRFWLLIGGVIVLVISLSVAYSRFLQTALPKAELPVFATVKSDLEATERSGKTVHFSDLKGKVIVAAYLYTQCPHGCAAVTAQLQKLNQEFTTHPGIQLLSVAIQPERDSVAMLKGYAEAVGATEKSPWWFITGDRQKLWDFMTKEVGMVPAKLIPEDERITPEDQYEHDLRIALLDGQGRVRGYYAVFHPQPEIASLMAERLHDHVHQLLDHPHS